jgi:alpha-tubulin suppressor-like RCC1 family protein
VDLRVFSPLLFLTAVWGCGANDDGQLALPVFNSQLTPAQIPLPKPGQTVRVACGSSTSYVLAGDGDCFAWGRNDKGQLGIGVVSKVGVSKPTKLKAPKKSSILSIECGWEHGCVVDGNVKEPTDEATFSFMNDSRL